MKMEKLPECSERIGKIKSYYMENSVVARDGVPSWDNKWMRLLCARGWLENSEAETTRLRKARGWRYMLENSMPVIFPDELIVGQPDSRDFSPEEQDEYDRLTVNMEKYTVHRRGRPDHMGLDYEKLLRLGVVGLIEEIRSYDAALDLFDCAQLEKHEYYLCCIEELEGLLTLERHYAEQAQLLSESASGERKHELQRLARILERVPAYPAETFYEALQSINLYTYCLYGIYSAGRPDQYLYPYYKNDIGKGIMTVDEAQELIDCFCLQYAANMASWAAAGFEVCGFTRDGTYVENELSWMFLNSVSHTNTADPSIGLSVSDHTSRDILLFASQLVAAGHLQISFWNDKGIIESMVNAGYELSDAYWWTHSTCVEITPIGKSGVSITSPYVNTLKLFLSALAEANDNTGFETLISLFKEKMFDHMRKEIINENLWQIERARNSTDPFMTSCLIDGCIRSGKSHDAGGAPYNFLEPNMLGMMNVTESLNVVFNLVYKEKRVTLSGLKRILDENYANDETLRQYIIRKLPHFGNNEAFTDDLAKRVADICYDSCQPLRTYRGAKVIPGAFAYREYAIQGATTPASPDGRKAGDPLTDGSNPVQSYDRSGPTASLLSTCAWEPLRFLGGIAVNLKLAQSTKNLGEIIASLVKAYIMNGGYELQITIADTETLLDAQKHPEQYSNLLVRIGGYSDYFTRLDADMQNEIIRRSCM